MWWFQKLLDKLYYLASTILLFYFLIHVCNNLWLAVQTRSIAFTIDTLYLDWNTSFPSVTICEIFNGEKIWDLSEKYNGVNRPKKIDDLLADISFFNGNCYACKNCENDLLCPTNFSDILSKFRTPCEEMIFNCTWNEQIFNCCGAFLPIETEFGVCYSINSKHSRLNRGFQLIGNREFGPGKLTFTSFEDIAMHLHSPLDVPYTIEGDIKETILYGSIKDMVISVIEMTNDRSTKLTPVNIRKCRFYWELKNGGVDALYNYYSHSTCTIECSRMAQLKYCNCTHHLMPKNINDRNSTCDYTGLTCLTDNFSVLIEEKRHCECLPSCEEPEYNSIFSSAEKYRDESGSIITISMIDLPKQRHKRTVTKTPLDLIISIGGICGLFFGLSFLSIIDFVYNILKSICLFIGNIGKCIMKMMKLGKDRPKTAPLHQFIK